MRRRSVLASSAALAAVALAGCAAPFRSVDAAAARERVRRCERQYIRSSVLSADEQLSDSLEPNVVDLERRATGVYVEVRTVFGTRKSPDDAPAVRMDNEVTASYYLRGDEVRRTDDPEEDPANGERLQCE
jgi:hypothetical protein